MIGGSAESIIYSTIQQFDSKLKGELLKHLQTNSDIEAATRLTGYFNFKFHTLNGLKLFPLEQESVEILRIFFNHVNLRIISQSINQPPPQLQLSANKPQNVNQKVSNQVTSKSNEKKGQPVIYLDLVEQSDDSDIVIYMGSQAKPPQKGLDLKLPSNSQLQAETIQRVQALQQSLKQPTNIPRVQSQEPTPRSSLPPKYEDMLKKITPKKKKREPKQSQSPTRKMIKSQQHHESIFKESRRHRWAEKMAKIIQLVPLEDFLPEPTKSDLDDLQKKEQSLTEKHRHQNFKELHIFVEQTALKSHYFHVEAFANQIYTKPNLKPRFNRDRFIEIFYHHEESLETMQLQKSMEDLVIREIEINQTRQLRIIKEFIYEQIFKSFAGAIDKYIKGWSSQILFQNRVEMNRIQQMKSCKPMDFLVDGNYEIPISKFIWRDSLNQVVIYLRIIAMHHSVDQKDKSSCQEIFSIIQCLLILIESPKLNGIALMILKDRFEEFQRAKLLQKSEQTV